MLTRLARDTQAAVLIEFAICAPILLILYLGAYAASDLVACNRKVAIATRALVDLTSRNMSPSAITGSPGAAWGTTYLSASAIALLPYSSANATEEIALLRVCDATHAYVIWTQAQTQSSTGTATAATPTLTAGTLTAASVITLPSGLIDASMVPVSPDSSNVCSNFATGTATRYQVGKAGGYLFAGAIRYSYVPPINYLITTPANLGNTFYMSPRIL